MLSIVCSGFQIWYIEFEMARNHGWTWLKYKWFTAEPWLEVRCNVWLCGRVKLAARQPQFILPCSSLLLLPSPQQKFLALLAMRCFAQWHAKALCSSYFCCSFSPGSSGQSCHGYRAVPGCAWPFHTPLWLWVSWFGASRKEGATVGTWGCVSRARRGAEPGWWGCRLVQQPWQVLLWWRQQWRLLMESLPCEKAPWCASCKY